MASNDKHQFNILHLAPDLWHLVCLKLNLIDLYRCSVVCNKFYELTLGWDDIWQLLSERCIILSEQCNNNTRKPKKCSWREFYIRTLTPRQHENCCECKACSILDNVSIEYCENCDGSSETAYTCSACMQNCGECAMHLCSTCALMECIECDRCHRYNFLFSSKVNAFIAYIFFLFFCWFFPKSVFCFEHGCGIGFTFASCHCEKKFCPRCALKLFKLPRQDDEGNTVHCRNCDCPVEYNWLVFCFNSRLWEDLACCSHSGKQRTDQQFQQFTLTVQLDFYIHHISFFEVMVDITVGWWNM